MNCLLADLNARTRDEGAERRSDISTCMLVKRIQYKHALGQNSGQHHNHDVAAVASIEEPCSGLGVFFMVLYQIANDQIGVNKPSLAHRMSSRLRAPVAAAWRIWAKDIP